MKSFKREISLLAVFLMIVSQSAFAQTPVAIDENAATSIPGVRLKTDLLIEGTVNPDEFSDQTPKFDRPLFQQVDPCRMISTRNSDQLVVPYGPRPVGGVGAPLGV